MPDEVARFVTELRTMRGDDLRALAASLAADTITDEVDWWRATIAIDKALRNRRNARQAAHAALDATHAVKQAALDAGIELPDDDVTRVARAAADVARGLAAGPVTRPIVRVLMEHWTPVVSTV